MSRALQMIHEGPVAVSAVLQQLRMLVREVKSRAYVPYSGRPAAVILLLSDGAWIPGVRVESASFSLTIPPLQNAWTTAVALGRQDIVAAAFSEPIDAPSRAFLEELGILPEVECADFLIASPEALPELREPLRPFWNGQLTLQQGIPVARQVARRAWAPHSDFPVGCLLQLKDGRCIPGVNVEHPDWTRTLCAERNALGTALSYGITPAAWQALFLSCLKDMQGTPCGACRQLLAEHRPDLPVWMDRGLENPPQVLRVDAMLPGFFTLQ